jgi:hypothetical protein
MRVHAAVRLTCCKSERVGAIGRLPSCAHMRAAVRLPSHVRVHDAVHGPSCVSESVCATVRLSPGECMCATVRLPSESYVRVSAAVRLPSCVHGRVDMRLPSNSCARESDASAVQSPCARVRAAMRSPTCMRLHAALFHDCKSLFPRLDRGEGAPEVAAHQTLLSELIHGLKQPDVQTKALFTDRRWRLVRSFAPRQSWLAVLEKNGFRGSRALGRVNFLLEWT